MFVLCSCHADLPVLFIQQTDDPACSYQDLCAWLGQDHNATVKEVSGDDHMYRNQAELVSIINDWVGQRVGTRQEG